MIDYVEIWKALNIIAQNEAGAKTIASSLKSGGLVTAGSVVGCAIGGPFGLYIGASVGSLIAYFAWRGSFKSVLRVIKEEMSSEEQKEVMRKVKAIIKKFEIWDAVKLMAVASGNDDFKELVIKEVVSYVQYKYPEKL